MTFEIANVFVVKKGQVAQKAASAAIHDCVGMMHPLYEIGTEFLAEYFLLASRMRRNCTKGVRKSRGRVWDMIWPGVALSPSYCGF